MAGAVKTKPWTEETGPQLPIFVALRRQYLVALVPIVLFVGLAVAAGLTRTPEYTSEARLNVGGLSLDEQSAEGYTYAVQQLALAYARGIHATTVVTPTARATGLSPEQVVDRTSADPIQDSPVIRVRATANAPNRAEPLANAAAASLREYAVELNSGQTASTRLLTRYRRASARLRDARARVGRTRPDTQARDRAQEEADLALLQKRTVGFLYSESQRGQATSGLVQQLAPAAKATSDRRRVLQDYVVAALLAGGVLGVGLALLRANAQARRWMRDA